MPITARPAVLAACGRSCPSRLYAVSRRPAPAGGRSRTPALRPQLLIADEPRLSWTRWPALRHRSACSRLLNATARLILPTRSKAADQCGRVLDLAEYGAPRNYATQALDYLLSCNQLYLLTGYPRYCAEIAVIAQDGNPQIFGGRGDQ